MKRDELTSMLNDEWRRRVDNNSNYSLRSFARFLGIDSSTLSSALSGKRRLSTANAKLAMERLGLDQEVRAEILLSYIEEPRGRTPEYRVLDETQLRIVSGWEHFAIMAVLEIKGQSRVPKKIAARLNISEDMVIDALVRLRQAGLIVGTGENTALANPNNTTAANVPSASVRIGLGQYIDKAKAALTETPVELRDISGVTMAIAVHKLPQAQKMIKSFRRRLCKFLENEDSPKDGVYRLNIQLFPISTTAEL